MKNNYIATITVLLFVFFVSCNDTEESAAQNLKYSIEGEWQTISSRYINPDGSGNHLLLSDKQVFKSDGTFVLSYYGLNGDLVESYATYKLESNQKTLRFFSTETDGTLTSSLARIKTLNDTLLVYHNISAQGRVWIIDSLQR